uniref:Uncharacterized protein n=1 Tax=Knipowitschia caucasica TaxID=637954 RepID=A0AAV2KWB6_KNICA
MVFLHRHISGSSMASPPPPTAGFGSSGKCFLIDNLLQSRTSASGAERQQQQQQEQTQTRRTEAGPRRGAGLRRSWECGFQSPVHSPEQVLQHPGVLSRILVPGPDYPFVLAFCGGSSPPPVFSSECFLPQLLSKRQQRGPMLFTANH